MADSLGPAAEPGAEPPGGHGHGLGNAAGSRMMALPVTVMGLSPRATLHRRHRRLAAPSRRVIVAGPSQSH